MPKTHPRTEVLSVIGALTYTLPALYGGWTVTGAAVGGTVTRDGTALGNGAVLSTGDALVFTPTAEGGTVSLPIQLANQEFSGNYPDLGSIPAEITGLPARVTAVETLAADTEDRVTTLEAAGPGTAPRLSYIVTAPTTTVAPSPTPTAGSSLDFTGFWKFTPSANVTLTGLEMPFAMPETNGRMEVYRVSDQALLGTSPYVGPTGSLFKPTLTTPVPLTAGTAYMIGARMTDGFVQSTESGVVTSYQGFTVENMAYYGGDGYPLNPINYYPVLSLLLAEGSNTLESDVIGPLHPEHFPVSTTAAAPFNSGFMVVNDAAKTAQLVWKFSDGTTKSVPLT